MKKYLSLILVVGSLVLLTGCDKPALLDKNSGTLNCTKTEIDEEDGFKTTTTSNMKVEYKNNIVIKTTETNITEYEDTDLLEMTYSFSKVLEEAFNEINGMNVEYSKEDNKIKYILSVEFDKIDIDKINETFSGLNGGEETEDTYYSAKNQNIEDFKNENLEGYTCK